MDTLSQILSNFQLKYNHELMRGWAGICISNTVGCLQTNQFFCNSVAGQAPGSASANVAGGETTFPPSYSKTSDGNPSVAIGPV